MHGPENLKLIDVLRHEKHEKETQTPNLRSLVFLVRSSSSKFLGVIACSFGCSERSNSGNVAPKCSLSSLSINTRLHLVEERCRMYSEYDLAHFRLPDEKMKSNIKTENSAGSSDKFSSLKSFTYAVIENIFNILKPDIHFNNT